MKTTAAEKQTSFSTLKPFDEALLKLIQTIPEAFRRIHVDLTAVEEDALQRLIDGGYVELEAEVEFTRTVLWRTVTERFVCMFTGMGGLDAVNESLKRRGATSASRIVLGKERFVHRLTKKGSTARQMVAEGRTSDFLTIARRYQAPLQYMELDFEACQVRWQSSPSPAVVVAQASASVGDTHVHNQITVVSPPVMVNNQLDFSPLVEAIRESRPARPPAGELPIVSLNPSQITIDGMAYALSLDAAHYLQVLVQRYGERVSDREAIDNSSYLKTAYVDRPRLKHLRQSLPEPVGRWLNVNKTGTKLCRPA